MGVEGGEASAIPVPAMGDSITEGTIVKWHKAVGDQIEMDEVLCEVETDKVLQPTMSLWASCCNLLFSAAYMCPHQ